MRETANQIFTPCRRFTYEGTIKAGDRLVVFNLAGKVVFSKVLTAYSDKMSVENLNTGAHLYSILRNGKLLGAVTAVR
jgi:hypothetical protein